MGKGGNRGNQGRGGHQGNKTRNQRRDEVERKRDERSHRNALKKERQAEAYTGNDDDAGFRSFRNQLQLQGFKLRDVVGDGNCLFRAFADQMDGNEHQHHKHRKDTVKYMEEHEDEFAPFLEETVQFKDYLKNLGERGTYGGNDSIVAFARFNGVDVVIHQHNNPTFIIEGNGPGDKKVVVHLAYHDYEHYSSVRSGDDPCSGPGFKFHKDTRAMMVTERENHKKEDVSVGEDESATSRRERRKNKKKNTVLVEGSTCQLNDDFVRDAVEELQVKSGCEDSAYIRKVFVDNSYDIDASLSFLFQTMHLYEESKSNGAETSTTVSAEDLEQSPESVSCKKSSLQETEQIPYGDRDRESECKSDEEDEKDDNDPSNSSMTCLCDCNEATCDCKDNDDINNTTKSNHKSSTNAPGKPMAAKHMSNRQRKEHAKQERKKRRQETRKADSSTTVRTNESSSSEQLSDKLKCINI